MNQRLPCNHCLSNVQRRTPGAPSMTQYYSRHGWETTNLTPPSMRPHTPTGNILPKGGNENSHGKVLGNCPCEDPVPYAGLTYSQIADESHAPSLSSDAIAVQRFNLFIPNTKIPAAVLQVISFVSGTIIWTGRMLTQQTDKAEGGTPTPSSKFVVFHKMLAGNSKLEVRPIQSAADYVYRNVTDE